MKAILEFNLDDQSDRFEHIRCVNATKAYLALHQIAEYLRQDRKYGENKYQEVSDMFYSITNDLGINLDDLE